MNNMIIEVSMKDSYFLHKMRQASKNIRGKFEGPTRNFGKKVRSGAGIDAAKDLARDTVRTVADKGAAYVNRQGVKLARAAADKVRTNQYYRGARKAAEHIRRTPFK